MTQTIGRYEIQRKFGEGGMAVVYLAHDPNFDRTVVVKVIQREYSGLAEFRARFNREAKVIAALEHEAIVPVHDFGEQDSQPFIVMRYLTGGSLADRMGHGPLPLPEVARIVDRIADALDYAHSRGVIHRDLKPGNILFDERGKAYLSDFGIAKLADATMKLTGTGIIGTPAYMSPEQARANTELDRRSDVYSVEAIAAGLPVVAVQDEAFEGMLVDGVNGRTAPREVEPFSAAIGHLLADRPTRQAFGRASVELSRKFSIEAQATAVVELYREAILKN